jgi:hypothetical protein
MVGSIPCFEGLLLSILGKRPPGKSADCKKAIQQFIDIDLTERLAYGKLFSKGVLEATRLKVVEPDLLLQAFEGR